MPYVQTLQCKIDSMESAIKESINSTVSSAGCDATGPITAALQAVQAGINGLSGKIEKDINLAVGQRIDATRKELQQQLDIFNSRVGELESRHDKTDASIAAMAVQIRELQQALEVARKQPMHNQFISRDFDRETDTTVIKVHADGLVTLEKATEALTTWITYCSVKESDFKVQGNPTSRFFTVQFSGPPGGPASRRAQKVLDSLRDRNGNWTRIHAPAVAGQGQVELRVGPDKSPKQIKIEIAGKRIRQALERDFPNHSWRVDRIKGWVLAGWAPVISFSVRPGRDEPPVLSCQDAGPPALGIDRAQLMTSACAAMILGIQEVRQDHAQLRAFVRKMSSTLDMHSSFAPGHRGMISGGVATVFPAGLRAESEALLPGRVLRTSFRINNPQRIFYIIHNYEISNAAIKRTPHASSVILFVMGDFNFAAVGKLKLTEPESRANAEATESSKASARKWHGALQHLVESEGTDTTHYCAETKSGSTIDRCFCSITPTQMLQLSKIGDSVFEATGVGHLSPPSKLTLTTELLREIAREARDCMLETSTNRGDVQLQIAKSIARAVWRQDRRLAARLFRVHQTAQDHLALIGEQVKLVYPVKFEEWASNLFRQDADQRQAAISHATLRGRLRPAQARAQSHALQRKIKFWNPISKRLVLAGVKTSVGTVMGPKDRLQKLAEHWQPVFEGRQIDLNKAADYLSQLSPKIDVNNFSPPDYKTLKKFTSRSSSTAPGMDGLPCIAWAAHEKCAEALWGVMCYMLNGGILPDERNAAAQAFPPKGDEPVDSERSGWHRDPSKVRVLGLRNTSMKPISSTMGAATATVAAEVVPASQRGFIHRRIFGYNVLELDVESRIASADPSAMDVLPVLASLDIAQAFPGVARQFVHLAPKAMGAPEATLNFFDSMCHNMLAMAACAGRGLCRACADDLGLVLKAVAHLAHLADVMILMDVLAGLELKAPKCRVIPLAGEVNAELILKLRSALIAIVPRFEDFNICDHLTCLGLPLGPGATEKLIFEKFALLPHEHFKNENWINASVLRFPNGAFRIKDWPHLKARGVHAPRSLQLATVAAIVRSATATFSKSPETRERLHVGLDAHGIQQTLMGAARGALHRSPPWWQMPPFVELLHQVAATSTEHAYYPSDLLRPAVAGALEAISDGRPGLAQRKAYAAALSARGPGSIGPFPVSRIAAELPHYAEFFNFNQTCSPWCGPP
ncbi:unnamed protein product [Prorocentrum cordatum]|uniref:Reverse transcriptase domain-containing protein n=1 Tax=Prorocentrum cordatum TaxID=2364126 RepID=A0ABN9XV06_9DINO|nr:unnamed protein product [Polarella glacialis]